MIRGEAKANLKDGRSLTLSTGFRALAKASAATGVPATEIFSVMKQDDGRQMLILLALIEGSLAKYHRDLSEDDIDQIMITDSETMTEALSVALNGSFSTEPLEQTDGGNAPTGTGTRSKATGRKQG